MKKAIFLLSVIVMTSCTCIMSQIPPLTLYVDETCGAALPDLTPRVTFTDNCGPVTLDQTPSPGSWLTEKYNTVRIRATDNFNNYTDILVSVELIDTVPPEFVSFDSTLIASEYDKINSLYDQAERMMANMDWWTTWPDSLYSYEDYANYYLVCYSSPLYAFRNTLNVENPVRLWTFAKPGSVITFPQDSTTIVIPEQ